MNTAYIKSDRLGRITLEYMAQAKNLFVDIWEKSFGFFTSYQGKEVLLNIKIVSIIISLVFGGLIIFLMLKMNAKGRMQRAALLEKNSTIKINNKKAIKRWKKIESKLISDSAENHKLAILEADDLFEEILKILGSAAGIRITNMDEIKEAKKIKNNIIDNSSFELNSEEAAKIIKTYKKGLTDLGII
jgi:hypothetical protein